jgi:hypothetical protein
MDDWSDLDICKRIAEIEGDTATLARIAAYNDDNNKARSQQDEKLILSQISNPIENDALCFQLIKKHNIVRKFESYDQMGFYYTDLENALHAGLESSANPPFDSVRESFLVEEHGDNKAALFAIIGFNTAGRT